MSTLTSPVLRSTFYGLCNFDLHENSLYILRTMKSKDMRSTIITEWWSHCWDSTVAGEYHVVCLFFDMLLGLSTAFRYEINMFDSFHNVWTLYKCVDMPNRHFRCLTLNKFVLTRQHLLTAIISFQFHMNVSLNLWAWDQSLFPHMSGIMSQGVHRLAIYTPPHCLCNTSGRGMNCASDQILPCNHWIDS